MVRFLGEWREIYRRKADQIPVHFLDIKGIMGANSALYDGCGDEITRMDNAWERVVVFWPVLKDGAGNAPVPPEFPKVEEALGEIIFHSGYVTIPNRVNQHLDKKWVGQRLDFHQTFIDEMPAQTDRKEILNRLYENPTDVHGIIDPNAGMIFHISEKGWRRIASFILMVLAFIGCGALAMLFVRAGDWMSIASYPFKEYPLKALILNYLAIMIGGLVHMGFNALKQYRANKEGSFVALGNWFLWGHVKEKSIIGGIFLICFVYLGCLLTMGRPDPVTVFFIGYSFDSFIDLFLKRFQVTVGKRVEAARNSLA